MLITILCTSSGAGRGRSGKYTEMLFDNERSRLIAGGRRVDVQCGRRRDTVDGGAVRHPHGARSWNCLHDQRSASQTVVPTPRGRRRVRPVWTDRPIPLHLRHLHLSRLVPILG